MTVGISKIRAALAVNRLRVESKASLTVNLSKCQQPHSLIAPDSTRDSRRPHVPPCGGLQMMGVASAIRLAGSVRLAPSTLAYPMRVDRRSGERSFALVVLEARRG
jgi:hypothetical protein